MEGKAHRIIYGYYSVKWRYGVNSIEQLKGMSEEVIPEEFNSTMQGKIFCPRCATPLSRTPSVTNVSTNNITAHFKHLSSQKYPESANCVWRVSKSQGLKYTNEEEVKKAIESKDLVIVSGWRSEPPSNEKDTNKNGEYTKTAVEDENGPETAVPISRHSGKEYSAPSHVSTVMAFCKDFPENLKRGFFFPNSQYPMLLSDQLFPTIKLDKNLVSKETLFFGRIKEYRRLDRVHVIEIEAGDYYFKIYTKPEYDERKHIDATAVGRYLLFSAKPTWESGNSTISCKVYDWGAYSLLPRQYNKYIKQLEK